MKIFYYILVSILFVFMTACSHDNDMLCRSNSESNALYIQPMVCGGVVTRTTPWIENTTTFSVGDEVNVSRTNTGVFYTYEYRDDSEGKPNWAVHVGNSYLRWNTNETMVDLDAYYPCITAANMNSYELWVNQTTDIRNADYMTYRGRVDRGVDNSVSFSMQRHTARVCVTIDSFGDQYDEENTSCNVEIYSPHDEIKVTYEPNGVLASGVGTPVLIAPYGGMGLSPKNKKKAIALVTPSDNVLSEQNFVKVTVVANGGATSQVLYVKGIPAFEAGYSYNYSLKVGKDVMDINSITVKPWSEPITVIGGIAVEN